MTVIYFGLCTLAVLCVLYYNSISRLRSVCKQRTHLGPLLVCKELKYTMLTNNHISGGSYPHIRNYYLSTEPFEDLCFLGLFLFTLSCTFNRVSLRYNSRQRFWSLDFVNKTLKANHFSIMLFVADLLLNKENEHVFSYPGLAYWKRSQV